MSATGPDTSLMTAEKLTSQAICIQSAIHTARELLQKLKISYISGDFSDLVLGNKFEMHDDSTKTFVMLCDLSAFQIYVYKLSRQTQALYTYYEALECFHQIPVDAIALACKGQLDYSKPYCFQV